MKMKHEITKTSSDPQPSNKMKFLFRAKRGEKNLRAVLFLVKEGQATHAHLRPSWRVEVVWPYYFLWRRDRQQTRTSGRAGA